MISGRIEGATRVLGNSQGYLGLAVRDEIINERVTGPETRAMSSAWFPTPDELAALNAGAPLIITLVGTEHPPILVTVGASPCESQSCANLA